MQVARLRGRSALDRVLRDIAGALLLDSATLSPLLVAGRLRMPVARVEEIRDGLTELLAASASASA